MTEEGYRQIESVKELLGDEALSGVPYPSCFAAGITFTGSGWTMGASALLQLMKDIATSRQSIHAGKNSFTGKGEIRYKYRIYQDTMLLSHSERK